MVWAVVLPLGARRNQLDRLPAIIPKWRHDRGGDARSYHHARAFAVGPVATNASGDAGQRSGCAQGEAHAPSSATTKNRVD
jgi:hypothetical protein